MASRVLAEGLIRMADDGPRLLGGRRKSDGKIVFPLPRGADADQFEAIDLASEGRLWSYTVQRFRPKTPYAGPGDERSFRPYAVGYVELADQVIVESRLKTDDFAQLRLGMPMRLTLEPFNQDPDGTEVLAYAFEPTSQQQAGLSS